MEIGGIGGFGVGESSYGGPRKAADGHHDVSSMHRKSHHHRSHNHGRHVERQDEGRASNMLRQEIRQALSTSFRLSFSATLPAYAANAGDESPDGVAADTLGAAKQLAERSPLEASNTLVSVRAKVEQAAISIRETLGGNDQGAIDDAMGQVSKGLDDLDQDAARNVVSSASVLSAETSLKQRSTIRIRTQEGDVVRLDLRRAERMSATDVAVSKGDTTMSATQVELSSRTRSVLSVKGDLNEAELAAIQNVFAQAEAIADEFFGGDLAAAFDMAAGMEFDAEQLSKVNMRFREKQVSTISYAAMQTVTQQPAVASTPPAAAVPGPVEPEAVATVPAAVEPEAVAVPEAPVEPETAATAPVVNNNAFESLAELLSNFLQAANQGFESGSFRYHYSESFKLEILKSVLQVNAPEESGEAAISAAAIIDAVSESTEAA